MLKILLSAVIVLNLSFKCAQDTLVGKWSTKNNEGIVEIYKSGDRYYGRLVGLKSPTDEQGKPRKDDMNKIEKNRNRQLLGILVIWDLVYNKDKQRFEGGSAYDPVKGHTVNCFIHIIDNNIIKVTGYGHYEWMSGSQLWTRK